MLSHLFLSHMGYQLNKCSITQSHPYLAATLKGNGKWLLRGWLLNRGLSKISISLYMSLWLIEGDLVPRMDNKIALYCIAL